MPHLRLSFDLRRPSFASATSAQLAETVLDICSWADRLGFDLTYFGEHHGAADGYLPSPLVASGVAAGRTSRMKFRPILLTPFYHPIRLAEDLAIADLMSGGRMSPVFAAGYVHSEFDMYGVGRSERRARMIEAVEVCRKAWTGEPFEFRGETVRVTPTPAQRPGPPIIMAGAAEAPARRAAHLGDGFDPAEPRFWDAYRDECIKLGNDPGPWVPRGPTFLHVTHDPDAAWAEVGPNLMHAGNTYAKWIAESGHGTSDWYPPINSVDELRAGGAYQLVTPEQCIAIADELGTDGHLIFRPLFGGTDPERAWASLRLFESEVLPHIEVTEA
ncbi:LLM class flavin-dependent oxidoreductase [Nocardia zapadnayensis]|uniref:LLM class flavin-dependent oxidoreductase n=1 Tax=Nocardia rhamnosiphila TaxID=426716 RepID=UPI0022475532|nr:LLM class flavin-dependent oxidoreductase [Nocardia zapadnayensis]MCX0272788.1 LLM class flavin-dependent oxidoreductase [Nocardia zapadnayensis]